MSNLGMYQVIVTQAKNLGGVDALIKTIESAAARDALKKAGPALLVAGAVAGAAATKSVDPLKKAWTRYKEKKPVVTEAKEQLKVVVEEALNRDDSEEAPDANPSSTR